MTRMSFATSLAIRREPNANDPKVVLSRLWLDVEAARRALARNRSPAIAHTARGLLTSLVSIRVRVELAHAAAAFAEGLDDRPLAEDWVYFAVAARATLDQAEKSGASVLAPELEELDEAFEDAREAVLLLEPEDYKEALAAAPPNVNAGWGERARIDAGLREIDLERAMSELADR
jgi:hypothetical protein